MDVITGNKKSKKKLLLLAGVHGNEYSPCILLNKIKNNIDLLEMLKKEYNAITFFNLINKEGLKNNKREFVNIDLNRLYYYDLSVISELKNIIDKSTHIIDLHSSPHCDNFILINNTDTANSYVEYAISNNINYVLYDQYNNFTIKHQSQLKNKVSLTFEMNGIGHISYNNILSAEKELIKILTSIHNIQIIKEHPKYTPQTVITAIEDGLYYINNNRQLVCLTLNNNETIYNIVSDNDFIATYPIQSFYKRADTILLVQEKNQLQ